MEYVGKVPVPDEDQLGPAMLLLNPMQRAFVIAMVETGGDSARAAATMAGYANSNGQSSMRLSHNPKVQAAIKEEAEARVRGGLLLGASVLQEIARDPMHKDRLKAALALMDRGGMAIVTEHRMTIDDRRNDKEVVARILQLAAQAGMDGPKLLKEYGVVDAEFTEIPATPAEPLTRMTTKLLTEIKQEVAPTTAGLEDLF